MSTTFANQSADLAIDDVDRIAEELFLAEHENSTYAVTRNESKQWWWINLGCLLDLKYILYSIPIGEHL